MQYCKKCGHELKPGQTFCPNCGEPAANATAETPAVQEKSRIQSKNATAGETVPPQRDSQKHRPFYRSGWVIIAAVLVIVICFGGFKMVQAMNKPSKVVNQFISSIEDNRPLKTASILNAGRSEAKADQASAKLLISYYKQNPDLFSQLKKDLQNQALTIENQGISAGSGDGLFTVKAVGKKWILFKRYGITAKPLFIKVNSNRNHTILYIDGKKQENMAKNKTYTYGPYLPAAHKIKASHETQYTTISTAKELDPRDAENGKLIANLNLNGKMVSIYSEYDDAILYVNGKSTGKKVRDTDTFGPVSTDGSMKLSAKLETPLGKKSSNTVTIKNSTDEVDLEFPGLSLEYTSTDYDDENYADYSSDDEAEIINTINQHYNDISSGDYDAAYSYFSQAKQNSASADYDSWLDGVSNNVENNVTVSVESIRGNKATANIYLVTHDMVDGNEVVNTFKGPWYLIKDDGEWKMNDSHIEKVK